jgi:hypothetical protein
LRLLASKSPGPIVVWAALAVETLLTPNLSLRAEYIHSVGTTRDVIAPLRYRVESGRARLGLSWKFGGETAAVVARY